MSDWRQEWCGLLNRHTSFLTSVAFSDGKPEFSRECSRARLSNPIPAPHDQSEVSPRRSFGNRRSIRSRRRRHPIRHDAGAARPHGERHPRARNGRGGAGEIRAPWTADGRGRHRHRAVHAVPENRSRRSRLARPGPFRAIGRSRLDADLRAAPSPRLRADDHGGDQALPPDGIDHPRTPRELHHARCGDDHRPARPGPRQRGRHGDRRAAPGGDLRQ